MNETADADERPTRLELVGLVVIAAVTIAVHVASGLGGEFVYDDHDILERNPLFESAGRWRQAFVADFWGGDSMHAGGASYYRPIVALAMILVRTLVGPSPTSFHAASLALHVASIVLVWAVGRAAGFSRGARLVAASVFALHPSTVEAIAWPSALSDPLATCFGFGAVLAMLRYVRTGSSALLVLASVEFGLALGTIERAIAFAVPLALALSSSSDTKRRVPGAGAIVAPIVVVLLARAIVIGSRLGPAFSVAEVLATLPSVVVRYARNLVAPFELAFAYPERMVRQPSAFSILGGGVLVALTLGFALWLVARARPTARFAILSAIAVFSPALALGSIPGYALVQDRYLYAALGFLGLCLGDLMFPARRPRPPGARVALALGFGALVTTWAIVVPGLRQVYASDLALYDSAVRGAPDNPHFLMNLSNELHRRRIPQADCALLLRAAEALEHDPTRGDPPLVYFNLGNCQRNLGSVEDALRTYGRSIDASGGGFDGPIVNSVVLRLEHGDGDGALALARYGTSSAPRSAVRQRLLGFVHARRGELDAAREAARRSVELDPHDTESRAFLASLGG